MLLLTWCRIGTIYNASRGQGARNAIGNWATKNYPEIWAELMKIGTEDPLIALFENMGLKDFKVIRIPRA